MGLLWLQLRGFKKKYVFYGEGRIYASENWDLDSWRKHTDAFCWEPDVV